MSAILTPAATRKMSATSLAIVLFCLLIAAPGVCFSPQPSAKEAGEMAALHHAGLNKDRSQLPALLAALRKPDDPIKRSYAFVALHALALMGTTEALPAINTLTSNSHDISLVNFAAAAKARILAENGAQTIKDPQARARAKIAALYQETKLTPDALNEAAKEYQVYVSTPGIPVPLGVCVMREAADVVYQEGVFSASAETAPPDYSLAGKRVQRRDIAALPQKHRCRYKRLRKRPKGRPNAEVYVLRAECLVELERLSEQGRLDLFYGDESGVSLEPCVPYAWQFADEQVSMPAAKGGSLNCFALLARDNRCLAQTTPEAVTSAFVAEQLDQLSLSLARLTVVVLDNAPIHHGRAVRQRRDAWQARGLFVFYLPTYSPHLNIAEVLWRKLKYEWLRAEDYADKQTLHYQVWVALKAVGTSLTINFSPFRQSEGLNQT